MSTQSPTEASIPDPDQGDSDPIDRAFVDLPPDELRLDNLAPEDLPLDPLSVAPQLAQKILQTLPSILYLYDVIADRGLYVNEGISAILGYSLSDLKTLGAQLLVALVHPEDLPIVRKNFERLKQAMDSEVYGIEYRLRHQNGEWCWVYDRSTVFERTAAGAVWQVSGSLLDISDRKRLEAQQQQAEMILQQKEALLGMTLALSHVGSWGWNLQDNTMIWNENHYRLVGLEPGMPELDCQIWRDCIHPADRARVEQAFTTALASHTDCEVEYRVVYPDGSLHWLVDRGQAIYNAAQKPVWMLGIVIDITDRKLAELELNRSRQQLVNLLASITDGFFALDADWCFTYLNPQAERLLHRSIPDLLSKNVWVEFPEAVQAEFYQQYHRAVAEQIAVSFEAFYPPLNCWFEVNAYPQAAGGLSVFFRDVTPRKQAQSEIQSLNAALEQQNRHLERLIETRTADLRQSEELFRQVVENAPIGIALAHPTDYRFLFLNPAFCEMLGYQAVELLTAGCPSISYNEDLIREQPLAQQMLQGEIPGYQMVKRYLRKDQQMIWGNLTARSIRNKNGDLLYILGLIEDITDRKQAEDALASRTAQLEVMNRELESFSYSVSHDLRAPLRHINGFVAALRQRLSQIGAADTKVAHYLEVIQASSDKMGQLIDGLLVLSRVGRRQLATQPVEVRSLVDAAIEQVTARQPAGHATETAAIAWVIGDLPIVQGDSTLLQQVFVNLLANAVKFSRQQQPARIEIGTLGDGSIFVRDNGVGFQMEYADQLFGAFQRLHSQAEFEGMGIGLAIVQRIVHRHNGTIWAESQPGQGATFYLRFDSAPHAEDRG